MIHSHEHKHRHHHEHHGHQHGPSSYGRAFAIGITLNLGFVLAEAVYGILAHSVALLADAGHNSGDVLGLVLAWGASFLARRKPSRRYTYGWRRSSILAALLNATLLLVVTGGISWEAIQRLGEPGSVAGGTIVTVAAVGVVINTATALLFMSGRKGDINIRAAFLHMAADAVVALGVVLAGIAILITHWLWLDPVISLLINAVVVIGTWQLLKDSFNLAVDAVPSGIEPRAVQTYLAELPGVVAVHDLHIWAMSTTETALTAHLIVPTGNPGDAFLSRLSMELHDKFGIEHTTIQVETGNFLLPCTQTSCN